MRPAPCTHLPLPLRRQRRLVARRTSERCARRCVRYTDCIMGVIDEVLAANEKYAQTHELRHTTPRPERKLAVLTCMDTRLSIVTLGLQPADAHIIRNAGGIVTDDALRSLIVSHYLLGTEEWMVINHTDCGLMKATEDEMRTRIQNRAGTAAVAPAFFYTFSNPE